MACMMSALDILWRHLFIEIQQCYFGSFLGAVYICTEDVFPSNRLQQLISVFNKTLEPTLTKNLSLGDHIFVEHVSERVSKMKSCKTKG